VPELITDHDWLQGEFVTRVQERGAAVIEARGSSSAASAANAVLDSVTSIRTPTDPADWVSLAVPSSGEYGVPEGLQFGYPLRSTGTGWEVVAGLEHDAFGRDRIRITTEELLEERAEVADLLG
jgi:malate dehydrogenase